MFKIWTIDKVMQLPSGCGKLFPNGRVIEMKYPDIFDASYNKYHQLVSREISIEITA